MGRFLKICRKEGRGTCFLKGYKKLLAVTLSESYHIQKMEECMGSLGSTPIFSTLHLKSVCWQVEIDDTVRDKTIFTLHHGLYTLARMLFELFNAPSSYLSKNHGCNSTTSQGKTSHSVLTVLLYSHEKQRIIYRISLLHCPFNTKLAAR